MQYANMWSKSKESGNVAGARACPGDTSNVKAGVELAYVSVTADKGSSMLQKTQHVDSHCCSNCCQTSRQKA